MKIISQLQEAYFLLRKGGIIAYPTEAVLGLGCDPFNQQTVEKLLQLKQRDVEKGFIILIAQWSQLWHLTQRVEESCLAQVKASWPGPVTWLFPKSAQVPFWLSGKSDNIAIRMSAHPIAQALCKNGPIISSSANISGQAPARNLAELRAQFSHGIDGYVTGALGGATQPSAIYNIQNGKRLR